MSYSELKKENEKLKNEIKNIDQNAKKSHYSNQHISAMQSLNGLDKFVLGAIIAGFIYLFEAGKITPFFDIRSFMEYVVFVMAILGYITAFIAAIFLRLNTKIATFLSSHRATFYVMNDGYKLTSKDKEKWEFDKKDTKLRKKRDLYSNITSFSMWTLKLIFALTFLSTLFI